MAVFQVGITTGEGECKELQMLWEALAFDMESVKIISITGAGGKTSVMFRLAEELKAMGKRVIVTTSTHIFYPDKYQVEILTDASELEHIAWKDQILVVGGRVEDGEKGRKLAGMRGPCIGRLKDWCDVVLIEADGSRRLPLKVPASHEPVIIPETDAVIGCAGLTCVGKNWEDGCFRAELALELLRDAGNEPGIAIRPGDVAHILADRNGTRKQVGDRAYRIVLNQADGEKERRIAWEIAREIRREVDVPVVITSNLTGTASRE